MSKISVLVPVYNTSDYLRTCLESLKNQSLKDIEIICINDGSTDDSLNILNEYANSDRRFKIINKGNTGYGHSMNMGLDKASGEYIGIVESDDYIDCEMYQRLYEEAKKNDADIVKSDYWIYFKGENIKTNSLGEGPFNEVFMPRRENHSLFLRGQSIWSSIYRRKMIKDYNIRFLESPGASYQDISFYFISMACADRVVLLNDAFLHYRQDNPNSSVKSTDKVFCVCDEIKEIWNFLEKHPELYNELKYVVPEFQWNIYQWNVNRLKKCSKFEFLECIYDEFELLNDGNLLKMQYWNSKENFWKAVSMYGEKNTYLCNAYAHEQMLQLYKKMFINEIKEYSKIFIYGAGVVGISVLSSLEKNLISPECFIVTRKKENVSYLQGYKVIEVDEITNDERINGIFLVSVKDKDQYSIIRNLFSRGCRNVIAVTKELRNSLRE